VSGSFREEGEVGIASGVRRGGRRKGPRLRLRLDIVVWERLWSRKGAGLTKDAVCTLAGDRCKCNRY